MPESSTTSLPTQKSPEHNGTDETVHGVRGTIALPVLLVVGSLAIRAYWVFGGWFQFDDVVFLTRVNGASLTPDLLFQGYGGHLLPGGFLLTWIFGHHGSLDFTPYAVTLVVFQALASLGAWFCLHTMFGRRLAVSGLLALYLFTAISLPGFIWWAAGVQQLWLQIALGWGLGFHIRYLRNPHFRTLAAALGAIVLGLLFYEKVLLVFGAIAMVTLCYFASGSVGQRLATVWRRYRWAVIGYVVLGAAYLVLYVLRGYNLNGTSKHTFDALGLIGNMVGRLVVPAMYGGPLTWKVLSGPFLIADPTPLVTLVTIALTIALVVHVDSTIMRSRRAWLLAGFFLAANVALVGTARASLLGPAVGLEFRNVSEMGLVVGITLGLAMLPLAGALESARPKEPQNLLLEKPSWAALTTAVVCLLGIYSSNLYAKGWREDHRSREYFANVDKTLGTKAEPTALVNVPVPQYVMWSYEYPRNTTKYVLHSYRARMTFPSVFVDEMRAIDDKGRVSFANVASSDAAVTPNGCEYRTGNGLTADVRLSRRVRGSDWWVRMSYDATKPTSAQIQVGPKKHVVDLPAGLHNVFFTAAGPASSIQVTAADPTKMCVLDADLGIPEATP